MTDPILLGEVAKLKAGGSAGGSLARVSKKVDFLYKAVVIAGSASYTTSMSYYPQSSSSYRRMFHHGSGQFSVVSKHYLSGTSAAEAYCRPFTVDQSTGAITLGTGSALFSGSSNIDTGTFAQSGNYVMSQSTSGSYGNFACAGTVSGNSVSGIATVSLGNPWQPMSNNDAAYGRSGSTMYMAPQTYDTANSRMRRCSLYYNGSSIGVQISPTDPSSNTSTQYTWPVAPQFGSNGPSSYMGLRSWQNSNGLGQLDVMSVDGTVSTTVDTRASLAMNQQVHEGFGLQLSNGRQLYYNYFGDIILNNAGSLSNVTETADFVPKSLNNFIFGSIQPVAADTWIAVSSNPREIVKFSIDPTTYKVTYAKSVWLGNYLTANRDLSDYNTTVYLTGSTNQYMVVGFWRDGAPKAIVQVFTSPF